MSLNNIFESSTQKEFDVLSQTTYSERLDVCRLKSKKTQQEFIGLILKEKDPEKRKKFFENRRHSEEIRAFVAEGYKGDAFLPETRLGKGEMILTPYAGEYLKEGLYNSLSPEEQKQAQKSLASFLNHMHQKAYSKNPLVKKLEFYEKLTESEPMIPLSANLYTNLDEILEVWKNVADKKTLAHLSKLVKTFKTRDKLDEKSVLIHNDICDDNVLYDKKSKKLAVIDFEYARIGNVYDDFCHFGGLVFPRKFITGVVKEYNWLTQESAHPSPISMKKLEMFWEIATLNNQACWVKEWDRTPEEAYKTFMKKWEKLNPPKQTRDGR